MIKYIENNDKNKLIDNTTQVNFFDKPLKSGKICGYLTLTIIKYDTEKDDIKDEYVGEVIDGIPHGLGKFTRNSGDNPGIVFLGYWHNGWMTGTCTVYFSKNKHHSGVMEDGIFYANRFQPQIGIAEIIKEKSKESFLNNKKRTKNYSNGDVYVGTYDILGRPNGHGLMKYKKIVGKGFWPFNKITTQSEYNGEWKDGERHGNGEYKIQQSKEDFLGRTTTKVTLSQKGRWEKEKYMGRSII